MALVKLHSATASIIQPNAALPGTPRRVRAMTAAQIDRPAEANSAAACTVVGQNTSKVHYPSAKPDAGSRLRVLAG